MKSVDDLPGSLGLPLIGETFNIFLSPQKFYLNKYSKYGQYFKTKILDKPVVVLFGNNAKNSILRDNGDVFLASKGWNLLEEFLVGGLLLQDGDQHHNSRKLISCAFSSLSNDLLVDIISSSSKKTIIPWREKKIIYLFNELRHFTLDVIFIIVFGRTISSAESIFFQDLFSKFVDGQLDIFRINIPQTSYGQAIRAKKQIFQYVRNEVSKRKEERRYSEGILGYILQNNNTSFLSQPLTLDELTNQVIQILLAGYETTAISILWLMYSLFKYPKIRQNIKKEITLNGGDINQLISQCTTLDYAILETERLFPPVNAIPRGLSRDFVFEDIVFPRTWDVHVSPLISHRLSFIFSQPNCFLPSRFQNKELRKHLFGYGMGQHSCLGRELAKLEAKVFLIFLLKNYDYIFIPHLSFEKAIYESQYYLKRLFVKLKYN